MRPLLNCIAAAALTASFALVTLADAGAQELQWVHRSQAQAKTKATTAPPREQIQRPAAKKVAVRQAAAKQTSAKQPTFRQPSQFKQPSQARPLPAAADVRVASAVPVKKASGQAKTAEYRNRKSTGGPAGISGFAKQVAPAQWEAPACDCEHCQTGEYYAGDAMCMGEATCGFPEPTCGSAGPCGCGDGCYNGEPGCGFGYGGEVMMGDPACGAPCCGDGCCSGGCADGVCGCGCGDACCGDAICEPTCGCGGSGCNDCRNWPQSIFGCDDRGCVPILWLPPIKEITFFGGVQGFKGPLDGNRDGGNFGFHEGFNIGGKMAWLPWPGLGYQFGYQATQNQLSGDANTGTDDGHSQHFVTTGLFHRRTLGLQWGVVWDMLRDERQGANDFGQVRGEVSFRNVANRELGFAFTANSNDNVINATTYQAADQYLFFYRIFGRQGGSCRAFAGFTGQADAVIGSDFHTPLTNRWSLEGNWAYLIPDSGNAGSAARDEAWNLSMQLVWHYGCRAKTWYKRPYRPMFNVADNGSLIVVD